MIPRIHPLELRDKLAAGEKIRLLDCREPEEYALCRIGDAPLIPLGDLHLRAGEIEIDDDEQLVVYCHHGVRSLTAVAILQNAGIKNAASLTGGIEGWSRLVDPNVPRY
jgi:rhodanese-related sulfurtransferase